MSLDANNAPRPSISCPVTDADFSLNSSSSPNTSPGLDLSRVSGECSPMMMSPWNQTPFTNSTWGQSADDSVPQNALVGSLVREEGHIYSLAVIDGVLYTGSDSKNIRVWKNLKEFSGFKSSSGLVKTIILSSGKVYTGHQDGKIRVWKISHKNPDVHKRSGTLPTLKEIIKCSIKPSSYVEVRRNRTALWIKHSDAVSCLSVNEEQGLLYSASWDRTIKVWRLSDPKCMESINAHDDAVNSVVASVDGLIYTGSADGTVKVWRREDKPRSTKHTLIETLLKQDSAVTALVVNDTGSMVYCGSSDGMVNFWEREKQFSHGGVLKGHKLAVLCLTAAGILLFSGSADKTICMWRRDGNLHTCLSVLTGHTGPVKCLAVEKDPESSTSRADQRWIVYSGSLDKSVKVWRVMGQAYDRSQMGVVTSGADAESAPSEGSFSSAGRRK